MTDDPLDRTIAVTLSLKQIFALRDIIADCLDHTPKPSVAAAHHSIALRAADQILKTAIRDDIHDR